MNSFTHSDLFQVIRLLDVFVLGPLMIEAGITGKGISTFTRIVLVGGGTATILFNGANFIRIQRERMGNQLPAGIKVINLPAESVS